MDPFEDIFNSVTTSADTSSTIDDDFDALFGNITVPSSSDLDSIILCEDDSLTGQDVDSLPENKTTSALADDSSETSARVKPKTQDRNETSISSDFAVGSSDVASVDLLTSLGGSETSTATSSSAISAAEPSKDIGVMSLKADESEKTETAVAPNSSVSIAGAQNPPIDLLCDLGEEKKQDIPSKESLVSNDLSDIFSAPSRDTNIFSSPSDGITDLFAKPSKHTDIFATQSKEETDLFATPQKKKPDNCASPSKEESDVFATPSEKETDIFSTQSKEETDFFTTPSKKGTSIFSAKSKEEVDFFSTPSKKETDIFATLSKDETDFFTTLSKDDTDFFTTSSEKKTDISATQSKVETTISKKKTDNRVSPSKKPTDIFATQTDEMDIFSTPPEKKTDMVSTDSEEDPDIFATKSKKKTPATGTSLFDEEIVEFLATPSSKEKVRDANQPFDALSEAADVKTREATLPDTADNKIGGDIQDVLENLDSLPEISDMEKVEPEPMLMEKEMDSSWILITDPSEDGDSASETGKAEKEVEKEDETEKDRDEKEKAETDNREQSDTKAPPTEENFMDFSILELPGYAHLNLDINKHKRTLSKKGSISRRKRPTRAAIHSGGTESEDMHFQDSTEPKPKVPDMSSDESKAQKDELFGGRDESGENVQTPEPSHPKPLAGGIKIPGLLEGLSRAKPFAKKTKKSSEEEEPKKLSTASEKKDTPAAAADSKKPIPVPRPSAKTAVPPATSVKPSALSRVLPFPASSKVLKDSQNKNIVEAQASVKPSSLKGSTSSGQAKLPPMKTETSPSPKLVESTKTPPPVARKPTVPSKPKTPPKSSSSPTASPVKLNTLSTTSNDKESIPAPSAPSTPLKKETPSPAKPPLKVPPKPRLKPIISGSKDGMPKAASSPSVVEKSNITLSPVRHPLPRIDKLSEKSELNEKSSEKKENIPLSPTKDILNSKSIPSMEKKKEHDTDSDSKTPFFDADKNEGGKMDLAPRKTSISGISPVSPPMAGEKSAPRKNSITGSAYAPIGFRSTIGSMTDGEVKSRTSSMSSVDESKPSLSRQSSEGQSTGIKSTLMKSTTVRNDQAGDPALRSKPSDLTNGKSTKLNSESVLKEANGSIDGDTTGDKTPAKNMDANADKGSTPWGVQLRRTEKKVSPPKPTASKETENPVNWRQSLGQRRRSSTPKEPVVEKPSEPEKPDWMKELSERRRRLINSGFIAGGAK